MTFLLNDLGRLFIIYVTQLTISGFFLLLAYKILKRNKNQLTIILSSFYILEALGLIINAIYPPIRINSIVFVLYFTSLFLIIYAQIFLILFNINILKIDSNIKLIKLSIFLIIYGILIFSIIFFSNGITIDENTSWAPVWTWSFLIILSIFSTIIIFVPFILTLIKLYMYFEERDLKKKLKYYLIGFIGISIAFYGGMLYNTWNEPLYKQVWSVAVFFIVIFSCSLIYYAWAHKL